MLRISKRGEISRKRSFTIKILGVLGAFAFTSILLLLLGHNPFAVFYSMLTGAFSNFFRIRGTLIRAIPLAITALGISIAFRMKFWNIGGEGQIMMGAFAATFVALNFGDLPRALMLVLMALAAFLFGGLWAFIPAVFKVKFGTNETLFTLMLNYIALKWVGYLQYNAWKDPRAMGFPKIATFGTNARLPEVLGIHAGWIIAILVAVFVYLLVSHTKKGYEINVVGGSVNTARYSGMKVGRIIILSLILSGGIAGLTGFVQVAGVSHTLSVNTSAGAGFTAIIVAWLAKLHPAYIILVSILFAGMIQGGSYIQSAFAIPESVAVILHGIILLFVLGSEFFIQYRINIDKKEEVEAE
ncbi:MAG: ABC transporter permease [Clostridia bacterium]